MGATNSNPKQVTVSVAHDGCHPGMRWSIKLEPSISPDATKIPAIQEHAAFAHLGSAAGNHGLRRPSCAKDANLYVDGMLGHRRVFWGRDTFPLIIIFSSRHSITKVQPDVTSLAKRRRPFTRGRIDHGEVVQSPAGKDAQQAGRSRGLRLRALIRQNAPWIPFRFGQIELAQGFKQCASVRPIERSALSHGRCWRRSNLLRERRHRLKFEPG